jgi:eukaryotic-like serine/threonine-protein kinase
VRKSVRIGASQVHAFTVFTQQRLPGGTASATMRGAYLRAAVRGGGTVAGEGRKYRAFISYSHSDSRWAARLHRALESWTPPRRLVGRATPMGPVPRKLSPIFRDREDLSSAADLGARVTEALERSLCLVVVCSPAAARSRWVNEEVLAWKRTGREDRIFCLIVDGEPGAGGIPGREAEECFGEALRFRLGPDGKLSAEPVEPIAADVRPEQDGWQLARLKLIAGMLGLELDELRQRELQRRQRRMAVITAGALAGMVLTGALAINAHLAGQRAERRHAQAEDLIGFMLGDLYQRLFEINRLDVYTTVGNKAMEYFAALRAEDLTDSTLAQRAAALRIIGETRLDQGLLEGALESFQESLWLAERLAERDPGRADWQIALAESENWIGFVHWRRGELDAAAGRFERGLQVLHVLADASGEDVELLDKLGIGHTNLGRVQEARGDFDAALASYEEVREIHERCLELAPENAQLRLELGFAHNNIGMLAVRLGDLELAEQSLRKDLEVKQAVVDAHPMHAGWQSYLAQAHALLGAALELRGNDLGARAEMETGLLIANRLHELDLENRQRASARANMLSRLGRLHLRGGELGQASHRLRGADALLAPLVEAQPDNAPWRRDLATIRIGLAEVSLLQGRIAEGHRLAVTGRDALAALAEQTPADLEIRRRLARAWLVLGDLEDAAGDRPAAIGAWQAVLESLPAGAEGTRDPAMLEPAVAALLRLGRGGEAEPVLRALREMGFRPQDSHGASTAAGN